MNSMDWTVAVLMGGEGAEREVSLESGKSVAQALENGGYRVIKSDIDSKNLSILDNKDIDVFFLALHGSFGEDGKLQQILEDRQLKYTGSNPKASMLAFDKIKSKEVFTSSNITTADYAIVRSIEDIKELNSRLPKNSDKFVIKPSCQGSSVGIEIVQTPTDAIEAAKKCFNRYGDTLIEKFIKGKEITVAVVGETALPIIEIKPKRAFYDYQAKYIDDATEFCFDTIEDLCLVKKIQRSAIDCFKALGCRHFSRIDFILTDSNVPFVLEANTIPGMTSHSLLPKAAKKAGMDMTELCSRIIDLTMKTV